MLSHRVAEGCPATWKPKSFPCLPLACYQARKVQQVSCPHLPHLLALHMAAPAAGKMLPISRLVRAVTAHRYLPAVLEDKDEDDKGGPPAPPSWPGNTLASNIQVQPDVDKQAGNWLGFTLSDHWDTEPTQATGGCRGHSAIAWKWVGRWVCLDKHLHPALSHTGHHQS